MFNLSNIHFNKPLLLAPMEDITNSAFRLICKELGADIVYTEFVNADGLTRNSKKTREKMNFDEIERPIGIQIYGGEIQPMVESAKIAESLNPTVIDINAGCWVKKVANRGAGAGLLKDPVYMEKMVREIVNSVETPVSVKTRLGWDDDSIQICDVAKRIQDAGAKLLTIHCRTRVQGHSGVATWFWVDKIKEVVEIPVILNGGIMDSSDLMRAISETNADGFMIARGAIGQPWIFKEGQEILKYGKINTKFTHNEIIEIALKHLRYEIALKGERAAIPFRKFYSGYLKGFFGASKIRQKLMTLTEYSQIEDTFLDYKEYLDQNDQIEQNIIS